MQFATKGRREDCTVLPYQKGEELESCTKHSSDRILFEYTQIAAGLGTILVSQVIIVIILFWLIPSHFLVQYNVRSRYRKKDTLAFKPMIMLIELKLEC